MPARHVSIATDLAPLAVAQHGLFTRAQVIALGLTTSAVERRVGRGEWVPVDHGVYRLATTPTTWHQRVLAACLAGPAVASHRCAAAILGVPGFSGAAPEVTARRHRRRTSSDVIWHESFHLDPVDVMEYDGIPVTRPARTLVDLATLLSDAGLVAAHDELMRRRLTTFAEVVETLDRLGSRRHGSARMRAALDRRMPATGGTPESPAETELDELLRRYGIPPATRQHDVYDGGRHVARLDYAYVRPKVNVESDGERFHSGAAARRRDADRDEHLRRLGWIVLRFTVWDLRFRPEWVASEIRHALRRRGALVDLG